MNRPSKRLKLENFPPELNAQLATMDASLQLAIQSGDLLAQAAALNLLPLVRQARILGMQFDAEVANPPYMGGKGMNAALKDYAKRTFPDSKSDLFAMFIERGFDWCKSSGFNSMVRMQSWMFLSSYQSMREKLLRKRTLSCMVHMGNGVIGIAFGTAAMVLLNQHVDAGSFSYCDNNDLTEEGIPTQFPVQNERQKTAKPDDFMKIPGSPVAYWASEKIRDVFATSKRIDYFAEARQGLATSDNNRFLRFWHEVAIDQIGFELASRDEAIKSGKKWFPYNKGGEFRKWYVYNRNFIDNGSYGFIILEDYRL